MHIISENKTALRREFLQRRATQRAFAQKFSEKLTEIFLKNIHLASDAIIAGYWPIRDEIDVRPILKIFNQKGISTALPVVIRPDEPLVFRQWSVDEPLVPGNFGVPIPFPHKPELIPSVILVPIVAFDRQGHRLGYGKGYYDRTLQFLRQNNASVPLVIGVAYAVQEASLVPYDQNDQLLDFIVTEREFIKAPHAPSFSR